MEWREDQIQELVITLQTMAIAINAQQEAINACMDCIEQLDARSDVVQSAYQGLSSRLSKLEEFTYGDGK